MKKKQVVKIKRRKGLGLCIFTFLPTANIREARGPQGGRASNLPLGEADPSRKEKVDRWLASTINKKAKTHGT